MAMRCFGRAFLTGLAFAADTPLVLDLTVLRAEDLAAVLWPDHFFFTAGCAAARDATFFLAMGASLFVCGGRLTQNFFVGWAKRSVPTIASWVSDGGHGASAPLPTLRPTAPALASMQPEHAIHRAQLGGLDQLGMRHRHGEQWAIELLLPEGEKILERRKFWKQIVVLPDIGLQQ